MTARSSNHSRLSIVLCLLFLTAAVRLHADGPEAVQLTDDEWEWLARHPVIRVARDPDWPPIEYLDENGHPQGISDQYLSILEKRLGIAFEDVQADSWTEALETLKNGKADMAASVSVTPERLEFLEFTQPYMKIPIAVVTERHITYIPDMRELTGKTLAVVEGYAVAEWLARDYPGILLKKTANTEEGLRELELGNVFGYVDNLAVISYHLAKLNLVNLKIAGQTKYENAQCMAARKSLPILARILQKALDTITDAEREEIGRNWMTFRVERGFDYTLLRRILTASGLISLILIFWILRLRKEIARRKKIEDALSESERRFRSLYETMVHGVVLVDGAGRIASANPAAERILELPAEKILGRDPRNSSWETIREDGSDFTPADHPVSVTLTTGLPASGTLGIRLPGHDGYRWLSVHSSPVFGDDGKTPDQVFVTFEDISERKNNEKTILAAQEETSRLLEETSRSRKALLSMVEDQKAVEEHIRKLLIEKEMLLKEVHHRIKNNMSSIHGLLTLQAQAQTDASAAKVLQDAAIRVQSMVILYDRLYRSDAIRDISLKTYFPTLVDEIASQYPNRKAVTIIKDIEDVILAANYVFSLGIIITELTTNAMKYAFQGREKGSIRIAASRKDNHLLIVFEDDGIGMSEPEPRSVSSGFGLKLLTTLVSQIDGTLMVETASGTKFTLSFDI